MGLSMFSLGWGSQSWTQCSGCDLTSAVQTGVTEALHLLAHSSSLSSSPQGQPVHKDIDGFPLPLNLVSPADVTCTYSPAFSGSSTKLLSWTAARTGPCAALLGTDCPAEHELLAPHQPDDCPPTHTKTSHFGYKTSIGDSVESFAKGKVDHIHRCFLLTDPVVLSEEAMGLVRQDW